MGVWGLGSRVQGLGCRVDRLGPGGGPEAPEERALRAGCGQVSRNMNRFRGGLVFKVHRLAYHSKE